MPILQQDRLVTIRTPLGRDVLLVETLEGTEAVSDLFRFNLVLVSEKRDIALGDLVGQRVSVAIELANGKFRYLNGFVSRFAQGDVDSRVSHYYAEVVPWLWFLTRTTDCRIFQRKSVPEIIQQIFRDLGFTDFKLQFQGTFEPREYCVQYRETDFAFVSRLMEEEGMFYFFEHQNGKHTLMVGNDPGVHQPCPNQAQAKYGYMTGGVHEKDMVTRLHIEQELRPGKVTLTDYYFQTPHNNLKVSTPGTVNLGCNGKFEIYDYPGYYAKRFDGDDKASKVRPDGERTAKLGMQGEEGFHKVLNGAGSCRAFVPGYKFDLVEHRRADLNSSYVLTSVSHTATNNLGDGEGATYDNTFTAIGGSLAVPQVVGRGVAYRGKHVGRVQIGSTVLDQVELVTRDEGATATGTVENLVEAFFALHTQLRRALAIGTDLARLVVAVEALGVVAGIVVNLELAVAPEVNRTGRRYLEVVMRRLKIVVGQSDLAGSQLLLNMQPGDHILLMNATGHVAILRLRLVRTGLMDPRIVAHHERMFAVLMLEEVEHTFFFHEAGDKGKVGFAILHAVLTRLEGALELEFEVGEAQVSEDLLDDLRDTLPLEDAAVGGAGEEPQPRHHFRIVVGHPRIHVPLREPAHEAVEVACLPAAQFDGDSEVLADQGVEGDVALLGDQHELEAEQLGDALGPLQGLHQEHVLAQGRAQRDQSILLQQCHVGPY